MKSTSSLLKTAILAFILSLSSILINGQTPPSNLTGAELRTWLKQNYYDGKHSQLGYTDARRKMYNYIDNHNNKITGVYSGYQVSWTYGGTGTNPQPINCEHTVPQSFFGEAEPMKSDIHHLFPTYGSWNSTRSNHPFAEIPDNETTKWMYLDNSQTSIPSSNIDLYSEYANSKFEPREDHKGNCARAIFYFYTMYPTQAGDLSSVADINELYQWHLDDPVDASEISRNNAIEQYQGDRNPYIDYPDAVAAAWDLSGSNPTVPATPTLSLTANSSSLDLSWTNVSDESGYSLYKSSDGSSYSLLTSLSSNVTNYSDNSVTQGTVYYYYVLAYNAQGNSGNSNIVSGELDAGTPSNGISVTEALAASVGTSFTVVGNIKESYNGVYALVLEDLDNTNTIIVKLESSQRAEWSPVNNPSVIGKTIEVDGKRDTYSSQPSIEYVTSIQEVSGTPTDTEAPTVPSGLVAQNIAQTTLDLDWNVSTDNVGVTGYDVYRNGSLLTSVTASSFSVTGLTANTTYSFYVRAKDAAGNISGASTTINVTTLEEVSNNCYVSNVTLNIKTDNYPSETTWDLKDESGQTVYSGGSYSNKLTVYSETFVLADGNYTFNIYDSYGDGICCSYGDGYYTLTDGNNVEFATGGSFGSSDMVTFCIAGGGGTPPGDDGSAPTSYCASKGSNASYEWIDMVNLGSINNSTGNDGGYKDYTNLSTDVNPGSQYTINYSCGFSSSSYTEYWHVWIDYNRDGDFEDANEEVATKVSSSSGTLSSTFTIPTDASIGNTRMRVTMKYNGTATPCESSFSYGEVEDYNINITNNKVAMIETEISEETESLQVLNIYPNPASEILTIEAINHNDFRIEVYSINGQQVMNTTFSDSRGIINVSNFENGLYLLKLIEGNKVITKKFIKQ